MCVCVCVPGTIQIQERQKIVEKSRMNELEVPCKRELDVVSKVCLSQTARWALLRIEMLSYLDSNRDKMSIQLKCESSFLQIALCANVWFLLFF